MYHQKAIDPNPLNIILVKSDSKGDRLLFRYPYAADPRPESRQHNRRKNPYSLTVTEDLLQSPPPQTSNISKGHLTGFTDEVLSTLFAVKAELCERKFELKVNDVRFVGHPTLLGGAAGGSVSGVRDGGGAGGGGGGGGGEGALLLIHLVFALRATASRAVVECYHDLSARVGVALRHEERRCGFLSRETRAMVAALDDHAARDGERGAGAGRGKADAHPEDSHFDLILRRSSLARDLRTIYEDLCTTGLVHVRINKWIEVSFCLPQKVHQTVGVRPHKDFIVEPETINRCLQSLRPYHGLLLLVEAAELLDTLPPDAAPALQRLLRACSPLKNLHTLAADADLTLAQVFQLTGHLVYWARAAVIFPLCESNVYVVAPGAPDGPDVALVDRFSENFPGMNLLQVMAEFSLPSSVAQRVSPLGPPQQRQALARAVVWLLRHRLLLQLHTYVHCFPTPHGPPLNARAHRRPHHAHGLGHVHGGGRSAGGDGSLRSTPDEQLSASAGGGGSGGGAALSGTGGSVGGGGGRAASESDLSSTLSDDGPSVPCAPRGTSALQPAAPCTPNRTCCSSHAFYGAESTSSTGIEALDGDSRASVGAPAGAVAGADACACPAAAEADAAVTTAVEGEPLQGPLLLQEELLQGFTEEERAAVLRLPAAAYLEDLQMLVRLYRRGYLDGRHHLEEIMYLENLRRSTLLQLLDKFRDILITHETEDPAISMFYPHSQPYTHW